MLGKFSTHEYHCTNKTYENDEKTSGAQKLRNSILGFFNHYRSNEAIEKYEVLGCSAFREEFKQLEDHVQLYWSINICKNFSESIRTNKVESFFATSLGFVPKNINIKSPFMYRAKMKLCCMRWNEKHISECYTNLYGMSIIDYRKNWTEHIHAKVFNLNPTHRYKEKL